MEVILFINAAISFALLLVHLVDYLRERAPLPFFSRIELTPGEAPPGMAGAPMIAPEEQLDRAA
jgi:hypothetical protein